MFPAKTTQNHRVFYPIFRLAARGGVGVQVLFVCIEADGSKLGGAIWERRVIRQCPSVTLDSGAGGGGGRLPGRPA